MQPTALFLVGQRGRDAHFRADGTLSIWTVAGRKRLPYTLPAGLRPLFDAAKEIDSVLIIERGGKLYGRVALKLDAPEPKGIVPVGIDLNETNALVAVDADGRECWCSGKEIKVRNKRTAQTTARAQRTLATKKAEKKDHRSVRRLLKRLSGRRRRRTDDFARVTAKKLLAWVPADAVLVLLSPSLPCPHCGYTAHADVNGATNVRNRFVQLRLDAALSVAAEALPLAGEGKPRGL